MRNPATPVAMAGFAFAAASGVCLLAANALEYEHNPVPLVKFSPIGLGLLNAVVLRFTAAWRAHTTRELSGSEVRRLGLMGGVSLVSWLTAVCAGRIIGCW
ncbi:MAG: hypothetical protein ACRDU5_15905 [Mycobacterium sp.]